ncbi:MAG: globin [Pseudomonadales bacterium]|nr:globin [Pseudomonadales bacterium]
MVATQTPKYGVGNATFEACGEEAGVRQLVDSFYDLMEREDDFNNIRGMHTQDFQVARDKLARFLCGWTGGPRIYAEKYGAISIPHVHAHLPITANEKDQWLACMAGALDQQPYPESLKTYLLEQLSVPAERIRQVCSNNG